MYKNIPDFPSPTPTPKKVGLCWYAQPLILMWNIYVSVSRTPVSVILWSTPPSPDANSLGLVKSKLGDTWLTSLQTHNLPLALFLWKTKQNSNEVRMCHNWFWIDYFRLNLYLIIEILVCICWRNEFSIARPLCWEITRNNAVNYFEFCPVFDKDPYIFERAMPPLWRVPIVSKFRLLVSVILLTTFPHYPVQPQY